MTKMLRGEIKRLGQLKREVYNALAKTCSVRG